MCLLRQPCGPARSRSGLQQRCRCWQLLLCTFLTRPTCASTCHDSPDLSGRNRSAPSCQRATDITTTSGIVIGSRAGGNEAIAALSGVATPRRADVGGCEGGGRLWRRVGGHVAEALRALSGGGGNVVLPRPALAFLALKQGARFEEEDVVGDG